MKDIKNLQEYGVEFKNVMNDIEKYINQMIRSRKIQFRNFDDVLFYGIYILLNINIKFDLEIHFKNI